jgi:competence protein ComEC
LLIAGSPQFRKSGGLRFRPLSGFRLAGYAAPTREALEIEWERGTAFLFIPVFLALGAIIYFSLTGQPSLPALAGGSALLFLASFLARTRPAVHLMAVALLLVMLGMLFAGIETWRAGTKMLGGEISTAITGRVVAIEHQANGRVRLTLDVLGTARPTLRYAPDRVRVSARAVPAALAAGSTVTGVVRLFPPSGPLRPGSYDFSFESFFDGIGANGFFLKDPELTSATATASPGTRFNAEVENARTALAERIRARIGGAEGEIAAALIAGTRAGIPEEVNEALRRTGLAHILSISGLHMALVAGTIMTVLRVGFAFFPGFASRRPVKKYAAFVALLAIAVYLFISGSAVAAERSFIMLAVMLTAVIFDRAALTMRNLAVAAIAVVVISPHEVIGPSFQMSFAATAALIGAYAWWSDRRSQRPAVLHDAGGSLALRMLRTVARNVTGLVMVSLIAGLATTIYGAYHFQRVSPLSLVANLAAMPIVSVLVMPSAVAAMAAMPFGLDGFFLDILGRGLSAMIAVAGWFSERSPLDAVGTVPLRAVFAVTAALVIATLTTTWLRLLSLPFLVAGLVLIVNRTSPDVLVSEDARLVAVPLSDGRLAVNRPRPNGFTVEDWMRATQMEALARPKATAPAASAVEGAAIDEEQEPDDAAAAPAGISPVDVIRHGELPWADGFLCGAGLCLVRNASGAVIAHAETADAARPVCQFAALIVIDDATAENPCPSGAAAVLTKRQLARRGAATVLLPREGSGSSPIIGFALREAYRPWHGHRQFSREARGLPPFLPRKQTEPVKAPE